MTLQEFKELFRAIYKDYHFGPRTITYRKYGFGPEMDTVECFRGTIKSGNKTHECCPIVAVYHHQTGEFASSLCAKEIAKKLGLSETDTEMVMMASDRMDRRPKKFFGL